MIPPEIRERVARGAELLDRVKPDWFEVVTPERLRMEEGWALAQDPCGCVLALNYGTYSRGLVAVELWGEAAQADGGFIRASGTSWMDLDAAWLEEADRRRPAKP